MKKIIPILFLALIPASNLLADDADFIPIDDSAHAQVACADGGGRLCAHRFWLDTHGVTPTNPFLKKVVAGFESCGIEISDFGGPWRACEKLTGTLGAAGSGPGEIEWRSWLNQVDEPYRSNHGFRLALITSTKGRAESEGADYESLVKVKLEVEGYWDNWYTHVPSETIVLNVSPDQNGVSWRILRENKDPQQMGFAFLQLTQPFIEKPISDSERLGLIETMKALFFQLEGDLKDQVLQRLRQMEGKNCSSCVDFAREAEHLGWNFPLANLILLESGQNIDNVDYRRQLLFDELSLRNRQLKYVASIRLGELIQAGKMPNDKLERLKQHLVDENPANLSKMAQILKGRTLVGFEGQLKRIFTKNPRHLSAWTLIFNWLLELNTREAHEVMLMVLQSNSVDTDLFLQKYAAAEHISWENKLAMFDALRLDTGQQALLSSIAMRKISNTTAKQ